MIRSEEHILADVQELEKADDKAQIQLDLDSIFACLKNNPNMPTIQQRMFAALGNMTDDQDNASQNFIVEKYDAITIIVCALKQYPNMPELQAQAYCALQKLSKCNRSISHLLYHVHLAHELVLSSMKAHANHIQLQTQAIALLSNVGFFGESIMARVLETMRKFVVVAELSAHGCMFVGNTALVSDDTATKLLTSAQYLAHEVILNAMRVHIDNALVQESGCFALASLAINVDNKRLLVQDRHLAHQAILVAMRTHLQNVEVQEQGCGALRNLAYDTDMKEVLVNEPYLAHQAVLAAMRMYPTIETIQEDGCGALCNLAFNSSNQNSLIQCESHIAIIAALRAHPQDEEIQFECARALSTMSWDTSYRDILKQADVLSLCEKAQRAFPDNRDLEDQLSILHEHLL